MIVQKNIQHLLRPCIVALLRVRRSLAPVASIVLLALTAVPSIVRLAAVSCVCVGAGAPIPRAFALLAYVSAVALQPSNLSNQKSTKQVVSWRLEKPSGISG